MTLPFHRLCTTIHISFGHTYLTENLAITQIISSNQRFTDPESIATAFNTFFQSVFAREVTNTSMSPNSFKQAMPSLNITQEGVLCLLRNLDVKKSSGPDDISSAFLNPYANAVYSICTKFMKHP